MGGARSGPSGRTGAPPSNGSDGGFGLPPIGGGRAESQSPGGSDAAGRGQPNASSGREDGQTTGGQPGGWGQASPRGGSVELNPDGGLRMPDSLPDFGGSPSLPAPKRGADNPYGDLADIIRRGLPLPGNDPRPTRRGAPSSSAPGLPLPDGPVSGGLLWRMIRGLFGSILGFQSKGIVSWIIRMVIMRYGWTLLRTVLGRGLGR